VIPALLEHLPADAPFVWGAGVLAVLLWALATALAQHAPGRRVLRVVTLLENSFLALLLLSMILLSFLQVVLRNLADAGYVWIDPLLRHLVLWVGFLGALLATRTGRHINIDALTRVLSPRAVRVAGILTNTLAFVVCLLVSNACMKLVREEWLAGTHGFLHVPVWILQLVMPLALFGMAVRFLGRATHAARGTLPTARQAQDAEGDAA